MAERNCQSCSDLQEHSPEFVISGVTENVCNSLKNNTGFNPTSERNDCDDLDAANDCLIGNLEDEVADYDVCDWQGFTATFIHNLWSVLKAIICSICGLWARENHNDCDIDAILAGKNFSIGESTSDDSYMVAGQGVSFLAQSAGATVSDITFIYIGGGLSRVQGTLWLHHSANFTDPAPCYSFDNDTANPTWSANRKKNTNFDGTHAYKGPGELLYEIRIKKSQYPLIKTLFAGTAGPTGAGAYQVNLTVGGAGATMYGQRYGSPTHTVPDGYIYIQARLLNVMAAFPDGQQYSPRGFMGIRIDRDALECDTPEPEPPTPVEFATLLVQPVLRNYDGTANVISTTGGTVSPASEAFVVGEAQSITLTATAVTGYTFKGWGNHINSTTYLSTNATYTSTMTLTGDKSIYGIFQEDSQQGTEVTESPSIGFGQGTSGTKSYTFAHTPLPNTIIDTTFAYVQTRWQGPTFVAGTPATDNSHSDEGIISISYDGDKTITISAQNATYDTAFLEVTYSYGQTYTIDLRVSTNYDTADPSGGSVSGGGTYAQGATVVATATPASGYAFGEWGYGGHVSSSNPYTFTATQDLVLYANFDTHQVFNLTVAAGDGDGVTLSSTPASDTPVTVDCRLGSSAITTLTFTAGTGNTLTVGDFEIIYSGTTQLDVDGTSAVGDSLTVISATYTAQ